MTALIANFISPKAIIRIAEYLYGSREWTMRLIAQAAVLRRRRLEADIRCSAYV